MSSSASSASDAGVAKKRTKGKQPKKKVLVNVKDERITTGLLALLAAQAIRARMEPTSVCGALRSTLGANFSKDIESKFRLVHAAATVSATASRAISSKTKKAKASKKKKVEENGEETQAPAEEKEDAQDEEENESEEAQEAQVVD